MADLFDRFRDWDSIKEQVQGWYDRGEREVRRQAELVKLRGRVMDLERRMNREFRVLGERVWVLHQAGRIDDPDLAGAFDALQAVSAEMTEVKTELDELAASEGPVDRERDPYQEEAQRELRAHPEDAEGLPRGGEDLDVPADDLVGNPYREDPSVAAGVEPEGEDLPDDLKGPYSPEHTGLHLADDPDSTDESQDRQARRIETPYDDTP